MGLTSRVMPQRGSELTSWGWVDGAMRSLVLASAIDPSIPSDSKLGEQPRPH